MDTGEEVACVRFKSTVQQLLSAAIEISDGVSVPNGGRAVSVLPNVTTRYDAEKNAGFRTIKTQAIRQI